ncbi:MAG TPA: hypothetical protein VLL72_01080 [Kiloniellales bacterium]|nr:hypothetical protein [Kiloniellales bacterium]
MVFATTASTNAEPTYPIEDWCAQVSMVLGGSNAIERGCIARETRARQTIRDLDPIEPPIHEHCDEAATVGTGSHGSYLVYLDCVREERAAQ